MSERWPKVLVDASVAVELRVDSADCTKACRDAVFLLRIRAYFRRPGPIGPSPPIAAAFDRG